MRYIISFLLLLYLTACSNYVSQEEMQAELKIQLQQQLNDSQNLKNYEMQVVDLRLWSMSDGVYAGNSTIAYAGRDYPVSLLVLVTDDQDYIVNIPNEDFSFLDEAELEKYRLQLEQEYQTLVGAFQMEMNLSLIHI